MVGSYSKMALGHRAYPEAAFSVGGARTGGPAGASSTYVPVGGTQYSGPVAAPVGMGGIAPQQPAGQMGGFVPPQAQAPSFNPLFNCPRRYIRFTTNCIPATAQLQVRFTAYTNILRCSDRW